MKAPTILDKATTNQSGEFQFDAVPPGSIELIHLSPTGSTGGLDRLIKEVTVEPGAEFSLNVIGPHQDTSH